MREKLLDLFLQKQKWTIQELEQALCLKSSKSFICLVKELNALVDERILMNNHQAYVYLDPNQYVIGTIKDISKYEFLIIEDGEKIYISKKYAKGVFEGDLVLVKKGRYPLVEKVLEHQITTITGTVYSRRNGLIFRSDVDYHRTIHVSNFKAFHLRSGTKVVTEIQQYTNPLEVKIIDVLGHEKDPGMDITSRLASHEVRTDWNKKILRELKNIPQQIKKKDQLGRKDLRELFTVTIDGDDAKDFDDAISIERLKGGSFDLYVHIADVSHYVAENSAIDQEAYLRSTSIYVCDRVIPMLPFSLSNGICSLNPREDRCTITCQMHINSRGRCTSYSIYPSLIHSDFRCTYQKVNDVLNGQHPKEYEICEPLIKTFSDCAKKLQKQANKRGAISFDTKESCLVLNKKGQAVDVYPKTRGFAEQMIEEAMILANVCVANQLHSLNLPCMYRVHEKPDPAKVESICLCAASMHVDCNFYPDQLCSKDLQVFLETLDQDERQVLSMVSLRAMQKAHYDGECIGHFGLALQEYCHFTSPIRRYSDLVVHRMLRKYLFKQGSIKTVSKDKEKIDREALHISQKEREAIQIEREINDFKKAEYMQRRIGKIFEGTIVGVQNFGFFVELENTVEGLVPVHTLYDDFYRYDELQMSLKAEGGHRAFQMGQKVSVVCTSVNIEKGQVEFALAN